MVRVIQAHNFKSQTTFNVPDDLLNAYLISSERIIIGRKDGTIEIKSLIKNNDYNDVDVDDGKNNRDRNNIDIKQHNDDIVLNSFNTIGDIEKILYCTTGHYILTLEIISDKINDIISEVKNVRVYINWDHQSILENVRVRVAGVTPSISERDRYSFEMIELPIKIGTPKCLSCCQMTGNIIIGLDNLTIIIYKFLYRTIDKKPYIDFEQMEYFIRIEYIPDIISITENIIISMNKTCLNAFKIVETLDNTDDLSDISQPDQTTQYDFSQDVDFKDILKMEQKNVGSIKIHGTSNIYKMNKNTRNRHDIKPVRVYDLHVCLCTNTTTEKKFTAKTLLKLRMKAEKITENQIDYMKLISVKPLYLKPRSQPDIPKIIKNSSYISCSFTNDKDDLRSQYYRDFLGCGLLVTTSEDGYLYLLEKNEKSCDDNGQMLLETFSFTAPLIDVVLEDALIYVITTVGLEIYTSKIGHHLFNGLMEENSSMINSPNSTEFPVCSVDMRPFFGVRFAFTSNSTLVLLAYSSNRDSSGNYITPFTGPKWTLYNLELPEPDELELEFSQKALYQANTDDFPAGYTEHLLSEAHVFIRLITELGRIIPFKTTIETISQPLLLAELQSIVPDNIMKAYNKSCIQLGDYYVMKTNQKDYSQAAMYYTMGNIDITLILERGLKHKNACFIGLIYTLKRLLRNSFHTNKIGHLLQTVYTTEEETSDGDNTTLGKTTNFLECLLELMMEHTPDDISKLAMQSTVLREHLREKIFTFLTNKVTRTTEDNICLILYYLQIEEKSDYNDLLKENTETELFHAMLPNWIIFFDTSISKYGHRVTSLSDFSEYCLNSQLQQLQNSFINIFIQLIMKIQIIKLDLIVKLFTDYIASHIGTENGKNAQNLLKLLLENFFFDYFDTQHTQSSTQSTTPSSLTSPTLVTPIMIKQYSDDEQTQQPQQQQQQQRTINIISNTNSPNNSNITSPILSISSSTDTSSDIGDIIINKNKQLIESLQILLRTYLDEWRKIDLLNQTIEKNNSIKNHNKLTTMMVKCELSKNELEQVFTIKRKFMDNNYIYDKWKLTYGNNIICLKRRKKYLDLIPPFFDNYLLFIDEYDDNEQKQQQHTTSSSYGTKIYDEIRAVLVKIESILCCDLMTCEIYDEVKKFINVNKNLSGIDGIMSCVLTKQQAIEYLLENCPQCLTQYGQECFTTIQEWNHLVDILYNMLINVMKNHLENSIKYTFYYMIMKELLEHIVATKSYDEVKKIFPRDEVMKILYSNQTTDEQILNNNQPLDIFLEYLHKSYNMKQSEKPKQVITNTVRGQMRSSQNKNNELF